MPELELWESFFDPEAILTRLGLAPDCASLVEFGCGYGTFTIPAARRIAGRVHALDIEPEAIAFARRRAAAAGLDNTSFEQRDFVASGSGLPAMSQDYAMVFNILHHEAPVALLEEVRRNLKPAATAAVIHWNHDPDTPRGPPMAMRPRPGDCQRWAREAGLAPSAVVDLPPHHYGLTLRRPN